MRQKILNVDVADHVATLTLNRPERRNAWSLELEQAFRQAMEQAASDPDVRVIVITGAGSTFCVGADMEKLEQSASSQAVPVPAVTRSGDYEQRYSWILAIEKPVIAAINGAMAGVGLCLALFCDLRFMAEGARLSTAFARRGLIAEHGIAWLLPRLIGPMNAADLLLSGRTVTAEEAQTLGLVRVLPEDDFGAQVRQRAVEIAQLSSPRSVQIIKRQMREARHQSLAQATLLADAEVTRCRVSDDFKEGIASFIQKRQPQFTGT
ncbi:enoyl-CoA hydratase-related protein [Acidovorax sp. JHL-9]|uniref:enoyl-CoA hydratase-related protein n=1 Tax=Acidovorax sp. JHL-9 TaxID=1276756 RepID=UPI000428F93E|nr:enoyl-CoA hydratase-related protein [Acidovorax sp. JHL-9]